MSLVQVKGNNTVEFKINITYDINRCTVPFTIDGCKDRKSVKVIYKRILCTQSKMQMYAFYLDLTNNKVCSLSYTLSILDREGRVFFTSKGKVQKNTSIFQSLESEREEQLLSIIDVSYLKACNVIVNDTFTVRFYADHELEAQEGSHPYKGEEIQGTVFISGLPEGVNEDELSSYFGAIGLIKIDKRTGKQRIWIYKDKITGKGKGEATITYDDPPTADSAINWFGGKDFQGKKINVQLAQRKSQTFGGSGGRSGPDRKRKCLNPECGNNNIPWREDYERCHAAYPESGGGDEKDTDLLETLSNNFITFYENKTDTDCVLRVGDIQFHVHRAILSARSSVFATMFHHDTAENRSGEVDILDIKATALDAILYYVYSGKIRGLTANTAASIYTAAHKYDLCELRSKCFEFLKNNLTLDNFCEVTLLAHTHEEMELEERVVLFIEENLDEVLESNAWRQFLESKTLLANKLLTSACKVSKRKLGNITTSKGYN